MLNIDPLVIIYFLEIFHYFVRKNMQVDSIYVKFEHLFFLKSPKIIYSVTQVIWILNGYREIIRSFLRMY